MEAENHIGSKHNRPLRMSWKDFQQFRYSWAKIPSNSGVYSSLEAQSGLFQVFRSENEMYITMMETPTSRARGIEEAINGLKFYYGLPIVAIDKAAADKIYRKRQSVRSGGKTWSSMKVMYDEHGAIVITSAKEVVFDRDKCLNVYDEYSKAKEKAKEESQKRHMSKVVAAPSEIVHGDQT